MSFFGFKWRGLGAESLVPPPCVDDDSGLLFTVFDETFEEGVADGVGESHLSSSLLAVSELADPELTPL